MKNISTMRQCFLCACLVLFTQMSQATHAQPQTANVQFPAYDLYFGAFIARFEASGSFKLEGSGWPAMNGNWKSNGAEVELSLVNGPKDCGQPGRYRVTSAGEQIGFELIADECSLRRLILDHSTWVPAGTAKPRPERRIVLTAKASAADLPAAKNSAGNWPSFRGALAAGRADKQNLPDQWDGQTGKNVLWHTPIPGLAHSSPIVWGNQIFVTSAVSSDPKASFRPGLYGDGDAAQDRTPQRWMLYALDKRTGKIKWERVAHQGVPLEKRHIKSTYANATPATDGRVVVAWFGSHGVHAFDVNGRFLWKVDLGRLDIGAYDIPTVEWGTASSPILWNGLVILQCDTQTDAFLLALDANTGKTVWKTERDELPSWGTPTVAQTSKGAELVTNAANFIRGYDPATGKELWRVGHSSKITAPTPIFTNDLFVIASGRAPERPIFAVKAGARGNLTLPAGKDKSDTIAWSRSGRGPYMPTPVVYEGILYVLANNGLLDAYDVQTGAEIYRQRLPLVGSGFSASPVAADGKLYLSNEDGEMLVIAAGKEYKHIPTNSMGELLMASPALSEGVMYVRSSTGLFAIGSKTK